MKEETPEEDKKELLEFCFNQGEKNSTFHLKCTDILAKASNNTLVFIIIFGGATLLGLVNFLADERYDIVTGLGAMLLYFFILAFLLLKQCLEARPIAPQANDPLNLFKIQIDLNRLREDQIMRDELEGLDSRIQYNAKRNAETGKWLNRVKYMIFFSPFIFVGGYWVAKYFCD